MFNPDFDPYDVLIETHNRALNHDQIILQMQNNMIQMSNMLNQQAQHIKHQSRLIQVLSQRVDLQEQLARTK